MISSRSIPELVLCGLGAATPVGLTAWSCAAAVRAGVSALAEHPFMVDSEGRPMKVAQCPWLLAEPRLTARIESCLITAVRAAFAPLIAANKTGRPIRPSLFVNLPSPRPGLPENLEARVRDSLRQAFPEVFAHISLMQFGHAGALHALHRAAQAIEGAPDSAMIVAGADSYQDPDVLEWLEHTGQLHAAGPRNNAWGFVPGEGAGAFLIASAETSRRAGLRSLGRLAGLGLGHEEHLSRSGTVCLGRGLTDSFQAALGHLPADVRVTDIYCDMNGEPYRADEFGFSVIRTRERFVKASEFIAPADCWGDVGAASASLGIVLACIASTKGYAKGPTALVWASSDAGERGAAVIKAMKG